ncbi:unknown protein (plasmid) [Calothrix sp. PCC 7716]|nr:unknown protein [Calothrix sp. PCC 7716]
MKLIKIAVVSVASMGLMFLGACSGGTQENASTEKTETTTKTAENASTTETAKSGGSEKGHSHKHDESQEGKEHSHGGQVVESGQYHLELVAEKEDKGTHLDFYLKKGEKHEVVSNAKITADIQSPDGKQKTVPLTYNAESKNYEAEIPEQAVGQYQVKVTADVGGEKLNGRFSFKQ